MLCQKQVQGKAGPGPLPKFPRGPMGALVANQKRKHGSSDESFLQGPSVSPCSYPQHYILAELAFTTASIRGFFRIAAAQ
jgi:hypothetical protein